MIDSRRSGSAGLAWLVALGASVAPAVCSLRVGAARTPPPTVTVAEARRMTVPILAEPIGTAVALQEVSVRARVRGLLTEIHFREGAELKKGQLLFVIDEGPFKAQLAEAKASLDQAEASLKRAQDSKSREVAAAQLEVGQSMLNLSEIEARREASLLRRNATTIEDVQRKQAIRRKDAAQVGVAKADLEQAQADYDTKIVAARAVGG